jgi:putative tricarboxylic transport membrane protein
MLLSQGSLTIFWSNPLVGSIAGLAVLMLVWPALGALRRALQARPAAPAA